jgi:lysophospholipase L1-like esterase
MNTNPNAKTILIYWDSLTHGKIPWWARYDSTTRFTGVVQTLLGSEYNIIEEGLRGRMLGWENTFFPHRNGLDQFGPIFASHAPVDMVVFVLGTNDCNAGTTPDYNYVSTAFDRYQEQIIWRCDHFKLPQPKVMIVCPPCTKEQYSYGIFGEIFRWADSKSMLLSAYYEQYSKEYHINFCDTSHISVSQVDGIHLDEQWNQQFAQALATAITQTLATS